MCVFKINMEKIIAQLLFLHAWRKDKLWPAMNKILGKIK